MTVGDRRVVVLSPKGGTGKTTVATNLAVGLARRRPGRVCLVDLDLAFGDVASALLIDPKPSLREFFAGMPPRVHRSGLHVIGAPETIEAEQPSATGLAEQLRWLGLAYSVVVADTGAGFDSVTQVACGWATDLVLVGSMDVPTLLGLRKVLRWLDALEVTAERHLVLNRCNAAVGLEVEDVVDTVRLPIAASIPSSVMVTRSVNAGTPLTETDGDDAATVALHRLVSTLSWARRSYAVSD